MRDWEKHNMKLHILTWKWTSAWPDGWLFPNDRHRKWTDMCSITQLDPYWPTFPETKWSRHTCSTLFWFHRLKSVYALLGALICNYPLFGLHDGGKIKEILEHLHAKYRTSKCQSNSLGGKIKEILECLNTCMLNTELPNVSIYRFDSKHQNI